MPRSTLRPLSVAYVATAPPRQCGIATFTRDLARAVEEIDPSIRQSFVAIAHDEPAGDYKRNVRLLIRQGDPDSYVAAAEALNESSVDVVDVQHEFGLFGIWRDPFEDHLAPFLERLRKPLVTTLHTILPDPSPSVLDAIRRIGRYSDAVIVMAESGRRLLVERYGLDPAKLEVIHHGVPAPPATLDREASRMRLAIDADPVVSTFGFVDPRKGLEYMIGAMAAVVARHPRALYLIVGRTHPELVAKDGEAYRESLLALVRERGLEANVAFIDRYLTRADIPDYLIASDVYVTPYLDPNQITSGTLSYAVGLGRAIVSTRYAHAVEALADGRGLLVDFASEQSLADSVLRVLDDPALKERLERSASIYGAAMTWPIVGRDTLRIFRRLAGKLDPAPVARPRRPTVMDVRRAASGTMRAASERE